MSHICQYCQATFTVKRNLIRHQHTIKSCLDIQRQRGVEVEEEKHACECGEIFTRRHRFTQHREKCAAIVEVVPVESATADNKEVSRDGKNPIVYLIVCSFINGLKIGWWNGSIEALWNRYQTYYGKEMTINAFKGESRDDETRAHRDLVNYKINPKNELYKQEHLEACKEYLVSHFGQPRVYDKDGFADQDDTQTSASNVKLIERLEKMEEALRDMKREISRAM